MLIERDKFHALLVVDHDIGEIDEQPLVIIEDVRGAISHGWDEKVPIVGIRRHPDPDPNYPALGHGAYLFGPATVRSFDARTSAAGAASCTCASAFSSDVS